MSLSQKHAGLILVPWFNADEWVYVYKLVYSNNKEKQVEALNLLKIWKMRTPILSTGVEGTLILLEVLVFNCDSFPEEHIANLYAVALMRFLNLSAANSEKQGSFKRTSIKNELPKWLTNMRHDIAHGHQIPSKYNLKMGLEFGFNWLKEKYWDPQSKIINDYYLSTEANHDDTLINSLKIYVDINIRIFEVADPNDEFYESVKNIIDKKFKRKNLHPYLMLEIFLQMISKSLEKECNIKNVGQCLDVLVSSQALLRPNIETVFEEEGTTVKIKEKFVKIWKNLINLLHHHGVLFCLVDKLFDVIGNIAQSELPKKMASMWINILFRSLKINKEPDVSKQDFILCLEKNQYAYTKESFEFQNKVIYSTEHSALFIGDFIDSLLGYNLSNSGFSSDAVKLVRVNSAVESLHEAEDKIYTIDDLVDVNFSEFCVQDRQEEESCNKSFEKIVCGRGWKKIEDTAVFKNCPLGVLPHQINMRHPFLILT